MKKKFPPTSIFYKCKVFKTTKNSKDYGHKIMVKKTIKKADRKKVITLCFEE